MLWVFLNVVFTVSQSLVVSLTHSLTHILSLCLSHTHSLCLFLSQMLFCDLQLSRLAALLNPSLAGRRLEEIAAIWERMGTETIAACARADVRKISLYVLWLCFVHV